VVLTGLSSVSPDELFGFEVHPPPAERVAVDRFLTIREVHTGITRPDEALRYSVQFEPQKTMSVVVDLIITKKSGGRWRFEMHLEASQPDLDGELVVEAGVGQLGRTPLYLYAQGETPVEFTARLTTDTDLDLEVQPRRGTLYPQEEDGTWETSSRPPSLVVTYRCDTPCALNARIGRDFRLYVRTRACFRVNFKQWLIDNSLAIVLL
jgi:hypothetical protein